MRRVWSGWPAILILVGGCEDVRLGWPESEPAARRPEQPRPLDVRSASQHPATRPDAVAPQFYQLVLLSEPSPLDTAPGVRMVRLRHGAARRLGNMLAMLYLPAGPTGSANRFTLVYASAAEWAAAGRAADIFEQALAGATSKPVGGVEFDAAAAGAYDILASTGDRERAAAGVEQLRRVAQDRGQKRWFRWAAGVLAGRIMADVLQDPPAAAQLFHIAGAAAQPGSLEQMSAIFAEAQARLAAGEGGPARRLLTRAVSEFDSFRDTEVFVRARRALAGLPSKG